MAYGQHITAQNITVNTSFLSKERHPQREIIIKERGKREWRGTEEGNK
jgi:hypothetical protein